MSNQESNYYYYDENLNNYFSLINNYINTVNNSINCINRSNEIISNMTNNMNYFYNYNRYYNNRNYVPAQNNRRRRVNNEEINVENNNEDNNEDINYTEPLFENQEQEYNNQNEETNDEREEIINNHYRELSRQNLINAITNNIRKLKFRDLENPIDRMCAITQEDFEPDDDVGIINNCQHIFKFDSLLNWLLRHHSCPNCRYCILTDTNLIRYIDTEINETLYLTNLQFRRYAMRRLFRNLINRNYNGSSNQLMVSFR